MKTRALFAKIASLSLVALGLMSQVVWAQGNSGHQPSFVPGRILVKFKDGVSDGQARERLAGRGALSTDVIPGIGVHIVQLPANANEQAEANAFKGLADVEFAEVDQILTPQGVTPSDTYFPNELYMPWIQASSAWSTTTGLSSITIASVDTGAYTLHPDLKAKLVVGWNFFDGNNNTNDLVGHGTWTAGVMASSTNNGFGVAGVCWGCLVMPIRVSDLNGNATESSIAAGITWASDHGARIANVGYAISDSSTVKSAALYLWCRGTTAGSGGPCSNGWLPSSNGGLTVAPSGQGTIALGHGTFDSTPDNPYIVTVGGTDAWTDMIWNLSNTGNNIDLTATDLSGYTTTLNGYGADNGGTCISAAIVSGVAALVWSVNPNLTPAQVTNILNQSADQKSGTQGSWNSTYGWGRVNALNAVNMAGAGSPPPAPVINSAATATGTVSTPFSYQITATNSPTSYGASGLPAGLTVNATGFISGTPTAAGSSTVTLAATNPGGTGYATLALTINPSGVSKPVITSATIATATVNTPFSYQITATNSPTSYGASVLPAGLTVNGTGLISGTPTAAGSSTVTLAATNPGGTGYATLALTINPSGVSKPVITSGTIATATVNTPFSYQITATNSPTSYSTSGLPTGLSVNAATGLISGTPTASGTFSVTLSATNSSGTGAATMSLTSVSAGISVSPTSLSVSRGSVGTVTVSGTGAGSSQLALTISGLPPQVTAAFAPTSVGPGSNSTLTITPAANGPSSKTYIVTITGNNGSFTYKTSLSLTIN